MVVGMYIGISFGFHSLHFLASRRQGDSRWKEVLLGTADRAICVRESTKKFVLSRSRMFWSSRASHLLHLSAATAYLKFQVPGSRRRTCSRERGHRQRNSCRNQHSRASRKRGARGWKEVLRGSSDLAICFHASTEYWFINGKKSYFTWKYLVQSDSWGWTPSAHPDDLRAGLAKAAAIKAKSFIFVSWSVWIVRKTGRTRVYILRFDIYKS